MKDEDRILLLFGWGLITILLILIICRMTYKMDVISNKLDVITCQISNLETHTETDAREVTTEIIVEATTQEVTTEITAEATTQTTTQVTTEATTEVMTGATTEADTKSYLGTYELMAYAWTGNRCANGNYPSCGYTVASNSIPMGSRIYIEGYGEYVVEDRGGMAASVIDVYMGDYNTCIQFGRRKAKVYLVE